MTETVSDVGPWNFLVELSPGEFTIPRGKWDGLWHNIVTQDYITRRLFPLLKRTIGDTPPSDCSVIDIGCNDGWLSVLLARFGFGRVVGIDPNEGNIRRARFLKRHFALDNLEFQVGDAETHVSDQPFDISVMLGVLNHSSNPAGLLRNVRKLTRTRLFMDVDCLCADDNTVAPEAPFHAGPYSSRGVMSCHYEASFGVTSATEGNLVFQLSKRALLMMLEHGGFRDVTQITPTMAMPNHYRDERRVFLSATPEDMRHAPAANLARAKAYSEAANTLTPWTEQQADAPYRGHRIVKMGPCCFAIPEQTPHTTDLFVLARTSKIGLSVNSLVAALSGAEEDKARLAEEHPRAVLLAVRELIRTGRAEEALILLEDLDPGAGGSSLRASILCEFGRAAIRLGMIEEGRSHLESSLATDPGNTVAAAALEDVMTLSEIPRAHQLFD